MKPDRLVVGNSVVMAWCFGDQSSRYTDRVLDQLTASRALVPGVWPLEVTNVLLVAQRRRLLARADAARFLDLLRSLPIDVEQELPGRVFSEVYALGAEFALSSYDASYLDLAIREGLPIATQAKSLRRAANKARVALFSAG